MGEMVEFDQTKKDIHKSGERGYPELHNRTFWVIRVSGTIALIEY